MSAFANIDMAIPPPAATPPPGTVVAFTDVGSVEWIVPDGVTSIDILCVGGGGGGLGDSSSPAIRGGGGSGGGVVEALIVAVTPGETLLVSVGVGADPESHSANGSSVERLFGLPETLAIAPPGAESNVENAGDYGNGGGGACAAGQALFPGPAGGLNGFSGGDGTSNDPANTVFYNGGGAGAGADGEDGTSGPGAGGAGKDMSAGWGTTYGENGVFGGGGGGNGYADPNVLPPAAEGVGHGANCGGGGSSDLFNTSVGFGDDGLVLIRY